MQYLGAETTVLETRPYIDRNNVLKLWTGSVNHISIRILQFILLKMCLLLGAQVRIKESFKSIENPKNDKEWTVITCLQGEDGIYYDYEEEYDIVICASGRKVPIDGFQRKCLEAKMSIAITANFVKTKSSNERKVREIPGLSKQYDWEYFRDIFQFPIYYSFRNYLGQT